MWTPLTPIRSLWSPVEVRRTLTHPVDEVFAVTCLVVAECVVVMGTLRLLELRQRYRQAVTT